MELLDFQEVQKRDLHIHPEGIFANIATDDLTALEAAGQWYETDGDMIIQDGHEQNYLYLVAAGSVEVFKYNTETNKKQSLATLEEGACMGEIAFLRGDVASANVKALKHTVVWRIDHSTLQQYIADFPGGAQLCLNLADVLAQRVQEGNTRLVGVSQSLSAYFGQMARQSEQKDIEAPVAAGTADMEIPRKLYDRFVCETLEYPEGSLVGDEHRTYVDEMVRNNHVDFVGWLEAGQKDQKLKVILKFVPLDKDGKPIPEEDDDEDDDSPSTQASPSTDATGAAPAPVRRRARRPQGHVVSVPQVQARVKARTAVIKEQPDRLWQVIHYGAYVLLPFVTALTIFKFLPLDARTSIAHNETYQSIPLTGIVDRIIFSRSNYHTQLSLRKPEAFRGEFTIPGDGYMTYTLELDNPLSEPATVKLKLFNYETLEVYADKTYTLEPGKSEYTLDTGTLPESRVNYILDFIKWDEPNKVEALFQAKGTH